MGPFPQRKESIYLFQKAYEPLELQGMDGTQSCPETSEITFCSACRGLQGHRSELYGVQTKERFG